jgi:drug/metabolite transporter (DMT)-like permease
MAAEPPPRPPENHPLAGIGWMLLTGLCFTGVNIVVKHVGQSVPPAQAVFLRYLTGLVFVLPMLPAMLRAGFAPRLAGRFCLRGVFHTAGAMFWFAAMALIPMGEVTAMGYLTPVYITLGAALFLGERIAARRLAAVGFAILGALIVVRPGFRELSGGHLAMLISSPAFALSYLLAKRLTDETSPAATVAWMSLTVTVFLAPFAWLHWVPVGWAEVGWLWLTAALATLGHYLMMVAFRAAPITVTQPVTFLQLVWTVSFGALLFAEPVDGFVILGGAVILGAVIFIAWREARLRRRQPEPALIAASP